MEELKEIMAQAQKLCLAFVNATNYAHNTTKEAEENLKKLSDMESKIDIKIKDVIAREGKVSAIENIVALEASVKALEKKNKLDADRIEETKTAFDKTVKDTLKEITQKTAKLADDEILLKRSWEDLRAKEKSYRAEIEADILKRFKK